MGAYKISNKTLSISRLLLAVMISSFLIFPGIVDSVYPMKNSANINPKIVTKLSKEIEIPSGSDYYIKFSSEKLTLDDEEVAPHTSGLSDNVKDAIAKAPHWIQRDLTRQFQSLSNPEEYADFILDSSKKYVDEIAFSIACSPLGNVPQIEVIQDNVFYLYDNDESIKYADIVDYDNGLGDYYSTVRYIVIENGTEKELEYPKEIYYWYVVHPELIGGNAKYIYGEFWRDYLFNHNDLGYPLLKEKMSDIDYLWDCESYSQGKDRLWKDSMEEHPTAIEGISYWIGKTVPHGAMGDRPSQPNWIAHEHNGWCGELQRIAVAAQRALLVPSVGASNIGEDHVWREFYERGWHENDNWWTDSGGAVDKPDVYAYGWGKNMSAVYAWNGDGSIYEVTPRYIHSEDRITAKFVVKDIFMQPIDGALVTVLVEGLKDITWYKNKIWEKIEEIWDNLPQFIKGKILQNIYDKIQERFEEIPDIVDGATIAIWNYTDTNGECTFELGKNLEYIFLIQQANLKNPWPLSKNNALRVLRNHEDATFNVIFADFSNKILPHQSKEIPEGNYLFDVSFDTKSHQLQRNVRNGDIGIYNHEGKIDFFVLDEENFEKYKNGRKFNCFNYLEDNKSDMEFSASEKDWYIVFRNHARRTNVIIDFSIQVEISTEIDRVQIVSPNTSIFENPVFNVGEIVNITGIATDDLITVSINSEIMEISTVNCEWFYPWNTADLIPQEYLITAECGDAQDEILIKLVDAIPPAIKIENPLEGAIFEEESIIISGNSWDNLGVERIEVALDDSDFREAYGKENWSIDWDVGEFEIGSHIISARAIDVTGRTSVHNISIVVNESGHEWRPQINDFYHKPENPLNVSNMVVYANVTSSSPFDVKKVVLYCDDSTEINSYEMYRYGENPVQSRHDEDPLKNESNNPIFGFELGQFSTGKTIIYWIVAYDVANNSRLSCEKSFTIS
jgi:Big-like domain-containing protein